MLAFTINNTKTFMYQLLKDDTFDQFLFRQGDISSFAGFSLDGQRNDPEEGTEPYCFWREIKPIVFLAVKGKQLPKNMKLVFSLTKTQTEIYPNTKAVFLNLLFREGELLITTATSQLNFSLDKQGEQLWEDHVLQFFKREEIGITKQS